MNTKELTVKVPEPLFLNLQAQAENEGITLEQIVVYALTRQTTPAYEVRETTDEEVREQKRRHDALLQSLRQDSRKISIEEAQRILSERQQIEPETELNKETIGKLRNILEQKSL
jgi:inner membrane protein involved in colicin E2 resistance